MGPVIEMKENKLINLVFKKNKTKHEWQTIKQSQGKTLFSRSKSRAFEGTTVAQEPLSVALKEPHDEIKGTITP